MPKPAKKKTEKTKGNPKKEKKIQKVFDDVPVKKPKAKKPTITTGRILERMADGITGTFTS
jgi:hypothetical protein